MELHMKMKWLTAAIVAVGFALVANAGVARADTIQTEKAVPLVDVLKGVTLQPVKPGPLKIPTITWGGDVVPVYGDVNGVFKAEGLSVQLTHEDDFAKQVRSVFAGETPFLRGTYGMINAAAEAFHAAGTDLVVLNQITWSHGGDRLDVRPGINGLADLKGKTIGLQLYGPHMDYATTILARAGLKPSDVKFKWFKELSVPSYDTQGKIVDARTAFQNDPSLDAVFVISPDSDVLTSNNAKDGGNGSEGSVKGAKVLFSTVTASNVIADVYAVRADWYATHKAEAHKFVHAMFVSQEKFDALRANKASNAKDYDAVITAASKLFENSKDDTEGMLGDAEFVGFQGNVAFFTGAGTTRNFAVMKDEIQNAFISLKLMNGPAPLQNADWDYNTLTAGLNNVDLTAIPAPKFDAKKAQAAVENQIATESTTWDQDGTLYKFEIYFQPNQTTFSAVQYADAFKKVLDLSQTFGGALVTIEGHNAPDLLNRARAAGDAAKAQAIEQAAKNLSLTRARMVRQAYIDYMKSKGITADESQFVAVGMGATHPKFAVPATKEQWQANMRVVFRVKNVETEMDSFQAPGK
jgi:ABC-type nitrate/sulfonate/bicarbonate transport system substrate-binding protein